MEKEKRTHKRVHSYKTESSFSISLEHVCQILMVSMLILIVTRTYILIQYVDSLGMWFSIYTLRNLYYTFAHVIVLYFTYMYYFHVCTMPGEKTNWKEMQRTSLVAFCASSFKVLLMAIHIVPELKTLLYTSYIVCDIMAWCGMSLFFFFYMQRCKKKIKERELKKQRIKEIKATQQAT